MFIEILIILNWVKFAIFLLYKKEEGGLQGFGWSNSSSLQVVLYKVSTSFQFLRV